MTWAATCSMPAQRGHRQALSRSSAGSLASRSGSMLTEKHQQGWATVRGSARVQLLLKPQTGQFCGVFEGGLV